MLFCLVFQRQEKQHTDKEKIKASPGKMRHYSNGGGFGLNFIDLFVWAWWFLEMIAEWKLRKNSSLNHFYDPKKLFRLCLLVFHLLSPLKLNFREISSQRIQFKRFLLSHLCTSKTFRKLYEKTLWQKFRNFPSDISFSTLCTTSSIDTLRKHKKLKNHR